MLVNSYESTCVQILLTSFNNNPYESRKLFAAQAFNANADYRGGSCAGQGNQCLKICIKRNDEATAGKRMLDNHGVLRFRQTDLARMHHIKAFAAQYLSG